MLTLSYEIKNLMIARAVRRLGHLITKDINFTDEVFGYDAEHDLNIWEIDCGEEDEYITWAITAYRYTGDVPPTMDDYVRLGTFTFRREQQ